MFFFSRPLDVQEVVLETDNFDEPCHGAGALERFVDLQYVIRKGVKARQFAFCGGK